MHLWQACHAQCDICTDHASNKSAEKLGKQGNPPSYQLESLVSGKRYTFYMRHLRSKPKAESYDALANFSKVGINSNITTKIEQAPVQMEAGSVNVGR